MPGRLLSMLFLLLAYPLAAAACQLEGEPINLSIQDFGNAYFRDFRLEAGRNAAQFWGGVCLEAADGSWTVEAETIDITGLQPGRAISVSATMATLYIPQWVMTAQELTSDGHVFRINGGTFEGSGLSGTISEVLFDLDDGVIEGSGLLAEGPGYRVTGESALFQDDQLTLRMASVTTCKCPGDPAYLLTGSEARLSLEGEADVTLLDGVMRLGFITMELDEEFTITNDTLSNLSPPFMIDWSPAASGEDPRGHGLAFLVPPFNLNESVDLEFGISGLDGGHPLSGYLLMDVATELVDLLVGYTRDGGPRADFSVRQPLSEHLQLTIGGNNRHYAQQSFLHEGFLTLATTFPSQRLSGGAQISYGGSITGALSSQVRSGSPVISPRLRNAVFFNWRLPDNPLGEFRLLGDFELSVYSQSRDQYGLRLRPSWNRSFGIVDLSLAHDWRLTDAGSPFSSTLDLLSPINRSSGSVRVSDLKVHDGVTMDSSLTVSWNWLRFSDGSYRGIEDLLFSSSLDWQAGDWLLEPQVRLQLAGLLDPRTSSDRLAFVEAGVTAENGDIELGVLGRHHLGGKQEGLELLELSAAYPLQADNVKLVPFVALDFAPAIAGTGGLLLSGHGLEVEWDSCCGLFNFGYRLHAGEFSTVLSAEFIR